MQTSNVPSQPDVRTSPLRGKLAWISTINPAQTLDVATWIETSLSLKRLGWDVALIGEGEHGVVTRGDIEVVCVPRSRRYFIGQASYYFAAFDHIAEHMPDVDVILFHQMAFPWIYWAQWSKMSTGHKRPLYVMDTRDLIDVVPGDWKAQLYRTYSAISHRFAPTYVDGQTAITPRLAELVGIRPGKLLGFWPSGVRLESFAAAPSRRCWPTGEDPVRLIYVGIFLEKRRLLELTRAVVVANRQGMHFQLMLYGDGPIRAVLEEIAQDSDSGVTINHPVPHQQIPELLAQAHVGVTSLPDVDDRKYQASSPIKLFEYLAAGMPVLATRNACHTDVVGAGRYAFWVDAPRTEELLSALSELWRDRDLLPELGTEALSAAADWSWDAAAKKLDHALSMLMESKGRIV